MTCAKEYPHGVFVMKYNKKKVEDDVTAATIGFFFVYIVLLFIFTVVNPHFGVHPQ
ncbi:MAG: hypothetical protein PSY14_17340 [bacterium]|nr:hypothetical protein [bacterium]